MRINMKTKRIKNAVKDLARDEGNRVAEGASLLQEGRSEKDHSHVSKVTPLDTKIKEFAASKADLGTELALDINKVREQRTTRLRRAKDVRPL